MKIGIITWFFGANYGAQAHSYALYNVLQNMGHTCEFIQYYPKSRFRIQLGNIIMVAGHRQGLLHPVRTLKAAAGLKRFEYLHRYYKMSPRVHNGREIDDLGYDLVILGSDEVFKINHQFFNEVNYGVGINHTPKMTYAPCSGETNVQAGLSENIRKSLEEMVALSARDKYTAQLLKNNSGRNVKIVLDPTFLYDFSGIAERLPEDNYILIYAFSELDEYQERIREYADEYHLSIVSIGRQRRWADQSYALASVPQWIGAFERTSLVITDSFHGTIFAIKNKKEFVRTGFSPNKNKTASLLEEMQISRGYYNRDNQITDYLIEYPIDYEHVLKVVAQKKVFSLHYLTETVEKVRNMDSSKEVYNESD